jgi:hypothetical protein
MYGIHSHDQYNNSKIEQVRERLELAKGDSRKLDSVIVKQNDYEKKLCELESMIKAVEINCKVEPVEPCDAMEHLEDLQKVLFGDPDEKKDEIKKMGLIEGIRLSITQAREECADLVLQYVENATPRQDRSLFEQLEKRIAKLEQRPKFVMRDAQSIEPPAGRISGFERAKK